MIFWFTFCAFRFKLKPHGAVNNFNEKLLFFFLLSYCFLLGVFAIFILATVYENPNTRTTIEIFCKFGIFLV